VRTRASVGHPMTPDDEADSAAGDEAVVWRRPSRSQLKRDADRVQALALRLVQMKPAELRALGLDAELDEAVVLGRELTKNARSRQLRRIAKLLRGMDSEALLGRLDASGKHTSDSVLAEQECEHWRVRLLSEGDVAIEQLLVSLGNSDIVEVRRELRQLVRSAKQEPPDARSRRARLLLLRKIRELSQAFTEAP